jgi:hypothetical protein
MGTSKEGPRDFGAGGIVPEDGLILEKGIGILPLAIQGFSQPIEGLWCLTVVRVGCEVLPEVLGRARKVSLDIVTNPGLVYLLEVQGLLSSLYPEACHLGPVLVAVWPFWFRTRRR